MTEILSLAALWLGLALLATLLSIWLRIATALSEIVVGTVAQLVIGAAVGAAVLGADVTWIKFLSGTGASCRHWPPRWSRSWCCSQPKWRPSSPASIRSPSSTVRLTSKRCTPRC